MTMVSSREDATSTVSELDYCFPYAYSQRYYEDLNNILVVPEQCCRRLCFYQVHGLFSDAV